MEAWAEVADPSAIRQWAEIWKGVGVPGSMLWTGSSRWGLGFAGWLSACDSSNEWRDNWQASGLAEEKRPDSYWQTMADYGGDVDLDMEDWFKQPDGAWAAGEGGQNLVTNEPILFKDIQIPVGVAAARSGQFLYLKETITRADIAFGDQCLEADYLIHDKYNMLLFGQLPRGWFEGWTVLTALLPTVCFSFDPLKAQRIGEASNPGPLDEETRKQIQEMVQNTVTQSLQIALASIDWTAIVAKALPHQGVSGRDGSATLASGQDKRPADNDAPSQAKSKRRKKKQQVETTATGQTPAEPPARQVYVAPGKDKNKGKGHGKGTTLSEAHKAFEPEEGWQVVARKQPQGEFQLRAQDWSGQLVNFESFGKFVDDTPTGQSVEAVVFASAAQIQSVHSILRGATKPYKVTTVHLPEEGTKTDTQKIPGRIGDRLVFRQARVVQCVSEGNLGAAPHPKGIGSKVVKINPTKSIVAFIKAAKRFCDKQLWTDFEKNPARAALTWIASHHVQALDTFGWVREKSRDGEFETFFGLARIPEEDLTSLMAVSGRNGVFLSTPRGIGPPFAVEWVDKAPGDKPQAYLERVANLSSSLGLIVSGGRLGFRRPLGNGEATRRVWQITDVPASWDQRAVQQLLAESLEDLQLLSHRRQKQWVSFRFRAKPKAGHGDCDPIPVVVEHLGANVTLWATHAPSRPQQVQQRPVRTLTVPVMPAAPAPAVAAKSVELPAESGEQQKPESAPKRQAQQVRPVPEDLKLVECPKDGNCMLHAVQKGLEFLGEPQPAHPRVIRAELVTHMLKHERYEKEWDGLDPRGQKSATDFQQYMSMIEKNGVFLGEAELIALARIYNVKIVVWPQGVDFSPIAVHCKAPRTLVLWYTDKHIDLLVPKVGAKYPDTYAKVNAGPVLGLRAGGRSSQASSCNTPVRRRAPSVMSEASCQTASAAKANPKRAPSSLAVS